MQNPGVVVRGLWPVCFGFFLTDKIFVEFALNRIFSILMAEVISYQQFR
jgi:hypothetical protein